MRTAGIFEAKQNFSAIVEAVEAGEEVRITRHGKEVARILPIPPKPKPVSEKQIARELRALRQLRSRVKPGPGWKELRDEGRRF
jgi:prevent-host-death family protein